MSDTLFGCDSFCSIFFSPGQGFLVIYSISVNEYVDFDFTSCQNDDATAFWMEMNLLQSVLPGPLIYVLTAFYKFDILTLILDTEIKHTFQDAHQKLTHLNLFDY